jgi:hypothetical protein
LGLQLLTAESIDLTEGQRQQLLAAALAATDKLTNLVTLPRGTSITLTSTRGIVPLTILSAPQYHAQVELRLRSQKLIFHPFSPPEGKCRVPTPVTEVCDLTLTAQNTTLRVPVETRSSGVFPLDVSLWTQDGSQQLGLSTRDTVRSTAVSGVGVILIIVAIVSLAIWWGRDLRHGRRARQLVPTPDDDVDSDGAADVDDSDGSGASDAVVRDFFSTPAPEYRDRPGRPRP